MGGIHIVDAQYHFSKEGNTLDAVPLERLMGPGVAIDVSSQCGRNPDFQIQIEDQKTWEKNYGQIQSVFGRLVIRSEVLRRD
jgi:kynurenine formamidase